MYNDGRGDDNNDECGVLWIAQHQRGQQQQLPSHDTTRMSYAEVSAAATRTNDNNITDVGGGDVRLDFIDARGQTLKTVQLPSESTSLIIYDNWVFCGSSHRMPARFGIS